MAAAGKAKGKAPQRRMTGAKQGQSAPKSQGTASAGRPAEKAPAQAAAEAAVTALDDVVHISGRGGFQLKAERVLPDGTFEDAVHLHFGKRGFIVADEETEAMVEQVLAGKWSDGRVTGKDFLRNARICGLQIIRHGLEKAPIPTWDSLAPDSRVDVALAGGFLSTPAKIAAAVRYEQQAPKRQPAREPEQVTLMKLKGLLDATAAGVKVEGVDAGGAASAGAPLSAGAVEL